MTEIEPAVLLFRGRGIISRLIRWQTRSKYSHAAIRCRDGTILESWQGIGVRQHWLTDWSDVDAFGVTGMQDHRWDDVVEAARLVLGCRYDYRCVFRFVSRRPGCANNRWFCSELVYHAVCCGGVQLLRDVRACDVSPAMLALSPLLYPLETQCEP